MEVREVAGQPALFIRIPTPRPGGVWRQWSFVVDGHAFVIVSAMPLGLEPVLANAVHEMVESFALER